MASYFREFSVSQVATASCEWWRCQQNTEPQVKQGELNRDALIPRPEELRYFARLREERMLFYGGLSVFAWLIYSSRSSLPSIPPIAQLAFARAKTVGTEATLI